MKNIFILSLILLSFFACSKTDYSGWDRKPSVYFEKSEKDSTIFSFAFDEDLKEGEVELKLLLIGNTESYDRHFNVEFDSKNSTAILGKDIELSDSAFIIKKDSTYGIIRVKINKTDNLKDDMLLAKLKLVQTNDFNLGLSTNISSRIFITKQLSKPKWWNDWQVNNGLGAYSNLKYRTFIKLTGIIDMTIEGDNAKMDYSVMRINVLKFKYWLEENPMKEEDGTDMTVAING
ncbi:MAG: DUF4843 domain-containing protein [Bacilli bacterium]